MTKNAHIKTVFAGIALALLTLSGAGCGSRGSASQGGADRNGLTLRIGYGKGSSLDVVRLQGTLAKRLAPQGVTVQWVNFAAGPQMLEGIGTDSIDFGGCAETPPIFAQAAGIPFVYVANIPPGKTGGNAILIPKYSAVHTAKDLKGKKIALTVGSVAQYYLAQVLAGSGLDSKDVHVLNMSPPDANVAFTSGNIDAWVIWEPYITLSQRTLGAHLLTDGTKIKTSGSYYLAARTLATAHPELVRATLEEIVKAGDWEKAQPHEAAALLASNVGLDAGTLEKMIRQGTNTSLLPIDDRILAQQQGQADVFLKLGILPSHVDVRQDMLDPQQYALIAPTREAKAEAPSQRSE